MTPAAAAELWRLTAWAIRGEMNDPEWDDLLSEALLRVWRTVGHLATAPPQTVIQAARWAVADYRRSPRARRTRTRTAAGGFHDRPVCLSLEEMEEEGESGGPTAPDFTGPVLDRLWVESLWAEAARLMPARYVQVLRALIEEEIPAREVAERLGIGTSRVTQIRQEALRRLRKALPPERKKEFR